MYVYDLIIHQCSVTFLWILSSCIAEETAAYRLLNAGDVFTTRNDVQFVPVMSIIVINTMDKLIPRSIYTAAM
jgi:hypothetical protein